MRALEAGADMILMPEDLQEAYEAVLQAVRDGRISEERINESVLRILDCKKRLMFTASVPRDVFCE